MKRNRLAILITCLASLALALSACSDDTGPAGGKDLSVSDLSLAADADAGATDKSTTDKGAADKSTTDKGATVDQSPIPDQATIPSGVACTKDADCDPSVPKCDPQAKVCVECLKDDDCKESTVGGMCHVGQCICDADTDCAGPAVWGARCNKSITGNQCGCGASTDCAKTALGPTCDTKEEKCTCLASTDCKVGTYSVCSLAQSTSAKLKMCNQACKADSECSKLFNRKVCDTTGGACVGCNVSADCATYTDAPWSAVCTKTRFCVECEKDADCTAKSLGTTCNTVNNWCTCITTSECATNENGMVCDFSSGTCSCKTDKDCPTAKKCTRTSSYLPSLKFCQ